MSLLIPSVVETTQRGERSADLYSQLLSNRIVFIGHPIGTEVANLVCAQILHLAADRPQSPVSLYINSPGGDIAAMLAIYDTMQHVESPVHTTCFGQAAYTAAVLVAAGDPDHRVALPNARFILRQPASEGSGQISDLLLAASEVAAQRATIDEILASHTGQSAQQVRVDTDRNLSLGAADAMAYGLVDTVLESPQVGPVNTRRELPS